MTELAALVAGRKAVPWVSTDDLVAERAGKPVAEVMVDDGEQAFRDLERQVVADLVTGFEGVVALGGGVVLDPVNEVALQGVPLVFVDVTLAQAAEYLGLNLARTTTIVNPRAQWLRMLEARRPTYQRLATSTVKIDGTPLPELAAQL